MAEIFSYDSIFIRMLNRIGDAMLLSVIFVLTSIPIFTIGASVTALYYTAMKGVKGDDGYVWKNYIKSFKMNFKQSTIMWLILAVVLFVFGVDLWFWLKQYQALGSGISKVMIVISVVLLSLAVMLTMYAFPLQAKFDNKTSVQLRNAFLLAVKNFPTTLLLAVITVIIGGFFYFQPMLSIIGFVLFGFGAAGYLYAFFMNRCFRPYLEAAKVATEEGEEEDEELGESEEAELEDTKTEENEGVELGDNELQEKEEKVEE